MMFTRSILFPSLIACVIAAPLLLSKAKNAPTPQQSQYSNSPFSGNGLRNPNQIAYPSGNGQGWGNSGNQQYQNSPFQQVSSASTHQTAPTGNPIFHQVNSVGNPASNPFSGNMNATGAVQQFPTQQNTTWPSNMNAVVRQPDLTGMTPDFGSAQTMILPGNANGPDWNAAPMEFMPVTNFEEIFRFNITPDWVKSRWSRVSTSPGDFGLHGLRVALVTGTNSWDLHGSLTYFFDKNQRAQRITFRGWGGDAKKLTSLLTQRYGFKTQPTQWAGFYLAQTKRKPTGGMLMQHPTVIYTDNPVQQIAIVLEMNNPQSPFELSGDFRSLIEGSMQNQ